MDNWTREQTTTLINLFRQCPYLYDTNHPDYVNKTKRNYKLHVIMNRLKSIKENVTIPIIKKKIRTLQSQMCKEKARAAHFKSLGLDESTYVPRLWCYKALLFLTNSSSADISSSSVDRSAHQQPKAGEVKQTTGMNAKMLSAKLQKDATEALGMVKSLAQSLENPGREQLFCTYLCSELKKITSDEAFEDLKMEILQLVHGAIKKQKATKHHARISPCDMIESESDNSQLDNDSYSSYRGRADTPNSFLSAPSPDISDPFASETTSNYHPDPLQIEPEIVTTTTKHVSLVKTEHKI